MDKSYCKKELVSVEWLKRAFFSSEVFSQILRLSDPAKETKLFSIIQRCLDEESLDPQSTIYARGESSKYIYFVKEGSVSLLTIKGEVLQQLSCYCEGELFGECESINLSKRSFTARAKSACKLLSFKVDKISSALKDYRQRVYPAKLLIFQNSIFFRNFMKRTYIEHVVPFSKQMNLIRHQRLYEQGHASDSLFLLVEGEIQLQRFCKRKNKFLNICIIEEGNPIGEVEAVLGNVRESRAVVTSQNCKVYSIAKQFMLCMMGEEATENLRKYSLWKSNQRNILFQKHTSVLLRSEESLIELLKKPVLEKSSQTTLLEGIDMMVRNKYKSYESSFGEVPSGSSPISKTTNMNPNMLKSQLFDFGAGLRPKVLHYRGSRLKKTKSELGEVKVKNKGDSKILDVKRIREMYEQQYNSLMIKPRLPPLLRSHSLPIRGPSSKPRKPQLKLIE